MTAAARSHVRTILGVVAAGLGLASPIGAAAAASGPGGAPQVVNRESVQTQLDPTGKVDGSRVYSQLTVLGNATVTISDPTSTKGLRNLDGFAGPVVRDGQAQYTLTVDGRKDLRTVADFTGSQPVTLRAAYTLDGKPVAPGDLVGRSGLLEATYTVVNQTSKPTSITYKNGKGEDVTETVDVVTPYVGSLAIDLPQSFRNVVAVGSDGGGDGRGGTRLSWSLILFSPLGDVAKQLRWKADVTNAQLPPASLQVVPVSPDGNPVLPAGKQTLQDGADAASALTAGAYKIDGSVLQLRAGAFKILDGLTQLSAGARALNAGLAGSAAPGATQLADGLGQAKAGGLKLGGGLNQLAGGTETLAQGLRSTTGQDDLSGGAARIAKGLASVRDGVDALASVNGLPKAAAGLRQLRFGLDHPAGTLGGSDPGGLVQGLSAIAAGLSHPAGSAGPTDRGGVREGLAALLDPATGLPAALAGVTTSKNGLTTSLAPGGPLDQLIGGATAVNTGVAGVVQLSSGLCAVALPFMPDAHPAKAQLAAGCADLTGGAAPTKAQRLVAGAQSVQDGVTAVKGSTSSSRDGLVALEAGLTRAVGGLQLIKGGVDQLAAGSAAARDAVRTQVLPGVDQLIAGLTSAVTGISGQLQPGVDQLATGSGTLAGKLGDAATGARQLADGSKTAAAGGGDLNRGLAKLADGAGTLAAGLTDAAGGSGKLAGGVDQVKDGVQQLADGSTELSGRGTSLLAGSANNAATDTARKVAILAALQNRAKDGALPYGAPQGAVGDAVFSYTLAGATSQSSDNASRGAVALVVLALGSLSGFVLRRRLAG